MLFKFLLGAIVFVALALLIGHQLMQMVRGDKVQGGVTDQQGARAQPVMGLAQVSAPVASTQPIELKLATDAWWGGASWAIGLMFGVAVLAFEPGLLWSRWLAWPVAFGMLVFSALSGLSAWADWNARLIASPAGIELRGSAALQTRFGWDRLAAVRQVEHWARPHPSKPAGTYVARRTLLFIDRQGVSLLEVDEPLRPPELYRAFLDAVPAWSGVAVTQERRE